MSANNNGGTNKFPVTIEQFLVDRDKLRSKPPKRNFFLGGVKMTDEQLRADTRKCRKENQLWSAGYQPRVAKTHSREEMVGPTVPAIVHPWNVARRATGRTYPPGVPPPPPKPWYNLICDFEDPSPPASLSFSPADIAKIAATEMGAPEMASDITFMLQRVDAWRYADQEMATVELDITRIPGGPCVYWLVHTWGSVGGNSIVLTDKWEAARCSYILPGLMADHPLGPWSEEEMITVRGNTPFTQVVRFHILWTYRDMAIPSPPLKA